MINYQLPEFDLPKIDGIKKRLFNINCGHLRLMIFAIVVSSACGFLAGLFASSYFYARFTAVLKDVPEIGERLTPDSLELKQGQEEIVHYAPVTSQEQSVIKAVEDVSPAVVNIIVTKDLPVYEQYFFSPFDDPFFNLRIPQYRQKGVEKQQVGGGTGFIISEDGMIITNKHVVLDEEADYTILTSEGNNFPVEVLARDSYQDIAVLKINQEASGEFISFSKVNLGDSNTVKRGQTAIAIGYVLGKYQNAVSVGVVSGLGRTITASGGDFYETLEDVIQTDAAINKGNSGGPLLNLKGEVIGINTAVDVEGQNIGFAIPINKAKKAIEQVRGSGKIFYPFLGVRYVVLNDQLQKENNLPVNYGAWVVKGVQGEPAVFPDSAAEKAGIQEQDILLEFNGEKITEQNPLADIILQYEPGDEVSFKILRNNDEIIVNLILDERSE